MHARPIWLATASIAVSALLLVSSCRSDAQDGPQDQPLQVPPGLIRASTQLVSVPVSVKNREGHFVQGLAQSSFHVWQDGKEQDITFFRQQNTPVTAGLVVDHSGSMYPKLSNVAAAVYDFAQLSNPEDQMFVVDFDQRIQFEPLAGAEFTSNPGVLQQAVSNVSAGGQTALYDAIAAALHRLEDGRWPMKALIVVSDGGDNVSHYDFSHVLRIARHSHAVIYAIGLLGAVGEQEDPGVLRRLCKDTGGVALFPKRSGEIAIDAEKIAQDIRSRYMVGYVPPENSADGSFHKIRVQVAAPGLRNARVTARPGFLAEPEPVHPQSSAVLR